MNDFLLTGFVLYIISTTVFMANIFVSFFSGGTRKADVLHALVNFAAVITFFIACASVLVGVSISLYTKVH